MQISPDTPLKIGTRGSPLALAQAHEARDRLMVALGWPEDVFEIRGIQVTGDRVQDRPLGQIGGKGLFTREIEEALLDGMIDIAVHSMKDMPVDLPDGLVIDCLLPREDVRDGFLSAGIRGLGDLARGAVVGTSSLRRRAQILYRRPDLQVVEFRGNVQTRLKKLADGAAEATFLAMAGLNRLGMAGDTATPISPDDMLPAIAQGAIGIERRANDDRVAEMLGLINDTGTATRLAAERTLLAGLDGSCQTPIAGLADLRGDSITLRGEVIRPDGSEAITAELTGTAASAAEIGAEMAKELKHRMGPGFF
ncbi:MAG: hydroxymethylbilane synthase [Rhodobacteraceae bacterium]|nr:hydroxymethylbilane synthase [Paracoccaceae bacterium]